MLDIHRKTIFRYFCYAFVYSFALFMLSGCAFFKGKDIVTPVKLPDTFSNSGNSILPDKWWLAFDDPQLDDLIEEALKNNFSILSAWDRLMQAEQLAVKAGASQLPQINLSSNAKRTRERVSKKVDYFNNYFIGLGASYEVDLWGAIHSTKQAALLDAKAARENVSAAAVTLSASITKAWYQFVEGKMQEKLLNKQLETNSKVLEIITIQFRQGQISASDVFRQQQLVESTRGQLIEVWENNVLIQHQLAVLLGRTPDTYWKETEVALRPLPELPETGIPSEKLRNRPDLLSAYKDIQAADYRVAAAVADQFPQINISSSLESSALKSSHLIEDWLVDMAIDFAQPIFDGWSRRAEVNRNRAELAEKIHDYSQQLLEAVQEVEDALNQEYYQRQYIESLSKQLDLARKSYNSLRQQFIKGQLDYLRVLESLVSQQTLERSELTAKRVLIEYRVDLCRAIAGSWEMERPEKIKIQYENK